MDSGLLAHERVGFYGGRGDRYLIFGYVLACMRFKSWRLPAEEAEIDGLCFAVYLVDNLHLHGQLRRAMWCEMGVMFYDWRFCDASVALNGEVFGENLLDRY